MTFRDSNRSLTSTANPSFGWVTKMAFLHLQGTLAFPGSPLWAPQSTHNFSKAPEHHSTITASLCSSLSGQFCHTFCHLVRPPISKVLEGLRKVGHAANPYQWHLWLTKAQYLEFHIGRSLLSKKKRIKKDTSSEVASNGIDPYTLSKIFPMSWKISVVYVRIPQPWLLGSSGLLSRICA